MASKTARAPSTAATASLPGALSPLLHSGSRKAVSVDLDTVVVPSAKFLLPPLVLVKVRVLQGTVAAMLSQASTLQARISRIPVWDMRIRLLSRGRVLRRECYSSLRR